MKVYILWLLLFLLCLLFNLMNTIFCPHYYGLAGQSSVAISSKDLYQFAQEANSWDQYMCMLIDPINTLTIEFIFSCDLDEQKQAIDCETDGLPFKLGDISLDDPWILCKIIGETIEKLLKICEYSTPGSMLAAIYWDLSRPKNEHFVERSAFFFTVRANLPTHSSPYIVIPVPLNDFIIEKSSNETWIVLALGWDLDFLTSFGSDKPKSFCEYELWYGSPFGAKDNKTDLLLTISETYPFVDQYLDNSIYSLRVPPGCLPSLSIEKSSLSFPDSWNGTQMACADTILITPLGYGTNQYPFNLENYQLHREIYCLTQLVTIGVDFFGSNSGTLLIKFRNSENRTIHLSMFNAGDPFPENRSLEVHEMSSVMIDWRFPSKVINGYLRVMMGDPSPITRLPDEFTSIESSPSLDPATKVITTTIKSNYDHKPYPLSSIFILFFGCAYQELD